MGLRLPRLRVSTDPLPSPLPLSRHVPPVPRVAARTCPRPEPLPHRAHLPPPTPLPEHRSAAVGWSTGRTSPPRVAPQVPGRHQRRRGWRCHLQRDAPRATENPRRSRWEVMEGGGSVQPTERAAGEYGGEHTLACLPGV